VRKYTDMNLPETQATVTLPDTLRLGAVHLTVTDLDRSIPFYEHSLGLRLRSRSQGVARMGAGEDDLLVLVEQPDARRAGRHAGLYHYALLFPSRLDLARAAQRLAATDTSISGASDHGISEAIYLPDPDGNGIELAADRPRDQWPDLSDPGWDGGPEPLDLPSLFALVADKEPLPQADPGLVVGHVHLHVGDVDEGLAFYRDILGFELMTLIARSAAFLAAGGYHHHVGINVWQGRGVPPAPADAVGLRHWTVVLDHQSEVDAIVDRLAAAGIPAQQTAEGTLVRDPWETAVVFTSADSDG
jgi:catechol 2,3-dioxygenase